nr:MULTISPECIES: subclass B1 metallo-beta-lactamase [unclassified Flagellimonas]
MKSVMRHKLLFILLLLYKSINAQSAKEVYKSEDLKILQLTEKTFIHVSYLETEDYGKVGCNGLIFKNADETAVYDTPVTNVASKELIDWIKNHLNSKIEAVIVTHSHEDCLGGLKVFHEIGIPSYASQLTCEFAKESNEVVPQNSFQGKLSTKIGSESVKSFFLGEGHTKDNIVGYIPTEKVLFGGCLIKTLGAGKGYIKESNLKEWPKTVQKVKSMFTDVKFVIPGHGKYGGTDLLDYTISMFDEK